VARHIFQACPVWISTQSNITSILFTWVHYTKTANIKNLFIYLSIYLLCFANFTQSYLHKYKHKNIQTINQWQGICYSLRQLQQQTCQGSRISRESYAFCFYSRCPARIS
jgi:hypothetical protein